MIQAVVLSSIALGSYIVVGIIVVRHNIKSSTNRAFLLYLAAMLFWQLTALLVSISEDTSFALNSYRLMTAGLGGQFIFFLFFTLIFLGKQRQFIFFYAGWIFFALLLLSGNTDWVIKSVSTSEISGLHVPEFGILVPLVGAGAFAFLGYGIYCLFRAFRITKSRLHKNRILYILLGAGAIGAGAFSNTFPLFQHYPIDVAFNVLGALLFAYAILRFQLLDITVVVRKGLLYSVPTIIIGTSYFLLITFSIRVFHAYTEMQFFIISLFLAVVTALIAQPLRDRAQSWIDRIFFREKYDAGLMLQRISSASAAILDMDRLGGLILDEISKTMHIDRVVFFLKNDNTNSFDLMTDIGLTGADDLSFVNSLTMSSFRSLVRQLT